MLITLIINHITYIIPQEYYQGISDEKILLNQLTINLINFKKRDVKFLINRDSSHKCKK